MEQSFRIVYKLYTVVGCIQIVYNLYRIIPVYGLYTMAVYNLYTLWINHFYVGMNNIKFSNSFEGEKYKLLVFIDI